MQNFRETKNEKIYKILRETFEFFCFANFFLEKQTINAKFRKKTKIFALLVFERNAEKANFLANIFFCKTISPFCWKSLIRSVMRCYRIGNHALNVYDASWALTKHGIAKVNIFTFNFSYSIRFITLFSFYLKGPFM